MRLFQPIDYETLCKDERIRLDLAQTLENIDAIYGVSQRQLCVLISHYRATGRGRRPPCDKSINAETLKHFVASLRGELTVNDGRDSTPVPIRQFRAESLDKDLLYDIHDVLMALNTKFHYADQLEPILREIIAEKPARGRGQPEQPKTLHEQINRDWQDRLNRLSMVDLTGTIQREYSNPRDAEIEAWLAACGYAYIELQVMRTAYRTRFGKSGQAGKAAILADLKRLYDELLCKRGEVNDKIVEAMAQGEPPLNMTSLSPEMKHS